MWRSFMLVSVTSSLLAGCGVPQVSAQELLATDLTHRVVQDNFVFTLEIDPWLARYPNIVREIRNEEIASISSEDCSPSLPCYSASSWELGYGGTRLVSLINTSSSYYGGAHGVMYAADRTFDLETGEAIRFGDVFSSWSAAQPLLQKRWCESMSKHSNCPAIEKQALAFEGDASGISGVRVQTSDYAFGSYAEGSDEAFLFFSPELVALVKPEYQPSFNPDGLCC